MFKLGMQWYNFFRTDAIPKIPRIGRYRSNQSTVFFFLINVEFLYISLTWSPFFCVLNNLLQCFSTGESKVLGMQPKSGSRDRSKSLADCIQPKHQWCGLVFCSEYTVILSFPASYSPVPEQPLVSTTTLTKQGSTLTCIFRSACAAN